MSEDQSEKKILEEINERIIKNFLDIVVMAELKKQSLSGYDFMALINKRFNILISAGTVYALLYSLERKKLIESSEEEKKRIYKLTANGTKTIDIILTDCSKIEGFLANILTST